MCGMKVTTIRMREDTVAEVEKLATELGMDNSSLLREALSIGLRELRTRLALDEYTKGRASLGKAAEIAGIGYRNFFVEAKKRGIQIRYGEERFEEELEELELGK